MQKIKRPMGGKMILSFSPCWVPCGSGQGLRLALLYFITLRLLVSKTTLLLIKKLSPFGFLVSDFVIIVFPFEMDQQSCEICKSWVDDIYWSHFQVLHFAQFLRTGFDQHLALPKPFSDNLKKKLPENVSLRGPGGIVWKIGLTTRDDTLHFTLGWQQFVKDNSLRENDFLVFKYNGGESLFDVLIFDGESFCEKAASYFVRKCQHTERGDGCSSKRKGIENCVEKVHMPSNAGEECVAAQKSMHDNSVRVPAGVPLESPSTERNLNAGVETASPEQFMHAVGDTEATAAPFLATHKRVRMSVSPDKHVQSKQRVRPPKVSEVVVEPSTIEKSVQDNCVRGPAPVPFKTPTSERTFGAGVESASPEHFMHANGDTVPTTVLLLEHGGGCSSKRKDTDKCVDEVNTPVDAGFECSAPEKSMHDDSVRVPAAVPLETPSSERTIHAGVESASPEGLVLANGDTVPTAVPSLKTYKSAQKLVSAKKHVLIKRRGRPPKVSSARQGVVVTDNSVDEVKTPSNAGVEHATLEKSVHDNSVSISATVPFGTPGRKRTSNAAIESATSKQFVNANGDTVPTNVPFKSNDKSVGKLKLVSAVKHVQTKRRGRPPKVSNYRQRKVDTDYWVEEIKTSSNAGVECASPKKPVHDNSVKVAASVPFKTPGSERAFDAGVESAPAEQFMDANGDTVPTAVPSQTTDKRARKLVSAFKHVHYKQRGRPPKVSSAHEGVVDTDNCVDEVNTPSDAGVECAAPGKSVHDNSVVPTAVLFNTPASKRTIDAGVESASSETIMHANGYTVPAAVHLQSTDKGFRIRKLVSADKLVQIKQRGSPLKVSSARRGLDSGAASVGQSAANMEFYTSNRRSVTEHEINNAQRLAQAACTKKSLLIVMQPENVYKRFFLSIPSKWIVEHLPPRSQDIILRMGKTKWHVKYCFHRTRYTGEFAGGWKNFALDNNLEEFDVCVFEPTNEVNDTMILDVNIFRVVEDIAPPSLVKSQSTRGKKRAITAIQT
ncbi:hypothetical protein RIF29_06058 [Crotalaria pallida]|uniref:TF-B3 domain-containing protein n=1 Tax=Crotalaria pallida TaxID=3830 RepID=A0AAN9J2S3_CROPI